MAKKQAETAKKAERGVDFVGIRLDVPTATRDRLRVMAAVKGVSMACYVRDLVIAHVDENQNKNKK